MGNTFGKRLQLHTWGESHGSRIGGILEGMPAGITLDLEKIQAFCDRRKPGQSELSTPRKESDILHISSGVFEGKTTGMPISFHFENTNTKSEDYDKFKNVFRPGHADQTYHQKYGNRDHRGGGRSSARETANWVAAGAIASHLLPEVKAVAFVEQIGAVKVDVDLKSVHKDLVEQSIVRCPDSAGTMKMVKSIESARLEGDSLGGVIGCVVRNVPASLGDPVFDKLHARLGFAMLAINAVKGFEYGAGFSAAAMKGSAHNDLFDEHGMLVENRSGGVIGGISNGHEIHFRVAFKPVASISKTQKMANAEGTGVSAQVKGRHDPCVVPRAVPIVEAMTYLVLADLWL
ncbi:MAG: chorismate synthase [Cryomorphaceae bacterium]|nr:chorismate synthase [Cryomorphaceae bacterium]